MTTDWYSKRGMAWYLKGNYRSSINDFTEALRLCPDSPFLYCHRSVVWADQGDFERAIKDYERAFALCPSDVFANRHLAQLIVTCSEVKLRYSHELAVSDKLAIRLTTLAVRLVPKGVNITNWTTGWQLNALAAAYSAVGQFDEAERRQREALETPTGTGPAGDAFRGRLELYKQKTPLAEKN